MQYKFKHIITAILLSAIFAVGCYSVAAVPYDDSSTIDYTDDTDTDDDPIDDTDQYPTDEPQSQYVPDESPDDSSTSYDDNDNNYDYNNTPSEDQYYFGNDNAYSETYEDPIHYNYENQTPGADYSLPEEESDLYETNDIINTSTLNAEDWEIALNFNNKGNDNGDFSYIKNNKSGRDNNKNIWMLFVGIALIVGAVIILLLLTISYQNKKKRTASFAGANGVSHFHPSSNAKSLSAANNQRTRINHKSDTAEIHLPQNKNNKKRKK